MSKLVKMHRAKSDLSRLVRELESGAESEIVIAVGNRPAARLLPFGPASARPLGLDAGRYVLPDEFDEPGEDIRALFESGAVIPNDGT